MPVQEQVKQLQTANPDKLSEELGLVDPKAIEVMSEADKALALQAKDYVKQLLSNAGDIKGERLSRNAVERIGYKARAKAAAYSRKLQDPIKKLYQSGEAGSSVGNSLVDLRNMMEELDPHEWDFGAGWKTRVLGLIPFVGAPVKRYFQKYESAQTHIDAILDSLDSGADQHRRDIITLEGEQDDMRANSILLQKTIKLGMLIDKEFQEALAGMSPEDRQLRFIQEELLYPLRQEIEDMQQELIVNDQGWLSYEVIIRNNKELIRGVQRAQNVTVKALRIAVVVALALADQAITLKKLGGLKEKTQEIVEKNAAQLRQTGVEIQKQAAGTALDIDSLKKAFADIKGAMDDLSRFRQEALPQMAAAILEMDKMAIDHEEVIKKLEEGNRTRSALSIEVEN